MALIELHPDLKRTNELLDRIARALELQLLMEHGVRSGHCAQAPSSDPNPSAQPTVAYATDEDTARRQLTELLQGIRQAEGGEVEVEQDGPDLDDWSRS